MARRRGPAGGDDLFHQIGVVLRRWRTQRDIDQGQLGAAAGVSRGSISRIETGDKSPELATLGRLLHALGRDLRDLQKELDEVNGRAERRRSAAAVDAATLARLRLAYPRAPEELLVERAFVDQELRALLARADELKAKIEAQQRSAEGRGSEHDDARQLLAQALRMLHRDWTAEKANEEAARRIAAEPASSAERVRR